MVPTLAEVNAAEQPFLGPTGEPVLANSLALLQQRWGAGCRDRETALRLLFLCWYCTIEPPFLTGVAEIPHLHELCREAYEALGGQTASDPEVCYTVKLMAELCPWCLGEPEYWESSAPPASSQVYAAQLSVKQFAGRGAYGEYFTHMLLPSAFRAGS